MEIVQFEGISQDTGIIVGALTTHLDVLERLSAGSSFVVNLVVFWMQSMVGLPTLEGRWLDLYSGTGSVGLEALSRGCDTVCLCLRFPLRPSVNGLILFFRATPASIRGSCSRIPEIVPWLEPFIVG